MKTIRIISGVLFCIFLSSSFAYAQKSNPVLSSRWFHPMGKWDTLSTIKVIKTLNPQRLDWMYCEDPKFITQLKELNIPFSLAMNPLIADTVTYAGQNLWIVDLDGKPYVASWMRKWPMKNPYWGCINNPLFQTIFYEKAIKLIDLGSYAVFVDDALFNATLQKETKNEFGCFCDHCLAGFSRTNQISETKKETLKDSLRKEIEEVLVVDKSGKSVKKSGLLAQYQEYQFNSVAAFLKGWKKKVLQARPGVKFLTNNYGGTWNAIYSVFDGGIAELDIKSLNVAYLDKAYTSAGRLGKTQLFTLVSSDFEAHQYLMAYCQLKGKDFVIPWDQFVPTVKNNAGRYYADISKVSSWVEKLKARSTVILIDSSKTNKEQKKPLLKVAENQVILLKTPAK